jgi:type II secretory pathway component PulK
MTNKQREALMERLDRGCPNLGLWSRQTLMAVQDAIIALREDGERIALLEARTKELLDELQNIANARPETWDDPSDFQGWAQSRARAAIAKAKGEANGI